MAKVLLVSFILLTWILILRQHLPPVELTEIQYVQSALLGFNCHDDHCDIIVNLFMSKGYIKFGSVNIKALVMSAREMIDNGIVVSSPLQGGVS